MTANIRIEQLRTVDAFEHALRPLTEEEKASLMDQIVADGQIRDPLVAWGAQLVDGHHRREIWQSLKGTDDAIPDPPVVQRQFKSDDDAIAWIKDNQRARRNLTPSEMSELRGQRYNATKGTRGGDHKIKGRDPTFDRATKIAEEEGVSRSTVQDDAKYAARLDKIESMLGPIARQSLVDAELPKTVVAAIAAAPTGPEMRDVIDLTFPHGKNAKAPTTQEKANTAQLRKLERQKQRRKVKKQSYADVVLSKMDVNLSWAMGYDEVPGKWNSVAEFLDSPSWNTKESTLRKGEYIAKIEQLASLYAKLHKQCIAYAKKHKL